MSTEARARKFDFNYEIYHDRGDKIPITRSSAKMAQSSLNEKKVLEL